MKNDTKILRVLIVDDDHWTTRALTDTLSQDSRFQVVPSAHNGKDAVSAYLAHSPDIVLMDINMPGGISGVEATKLIRAQDPEAKILILSTVAPGPGLSRALDAGAIAAVNKSAPERTLKETIVLAAAGENPRLLKNLAQDIVISGDYLPDSPSKAPELTPAEEVVLRLICEGLDYESIAKELFVSAWTVKTHARKLREKLYADNLAQLVVRALQFHYITA